MILRRCKKRHIIIANIYHIYENNARRAVPYYVVCRISADDVTVVLK